MTRRPLTEKPQIEFISVAALRDWLAENGTVSDGIWAVTYKKAVTDKYISTSEIIDACLSFGWVDSLVRAKDDQRTMLYICPRKAGSNWSRVNKEKIAQLNAAGLLAKAGADVVARSKADGSWTALDDVENLIIPPDLQAAFNQSAGAEANWSNFPRSVKRGALEILLNAKRAETRAKKITTIVHDSAANRRPFQWSPKGNP